MQENRNLKRSLRLRFNSLLLARIQLWAEWGSGVAKQRHETKIHVLLDMAVKQRQARLVGDQIHRGAPKCGNDHGVLPDASGRFAVEFDELEQVPVDM